MEISKKQKVCPICGKTFTPKTINSVYCSHPCSSKAFKQKKAQQQKDEKLKAIVGAIPSQRQYLSVQEAIAIFGVSKSTLYRLIRFGQIPTINLGARLIRIDRQKLESLFPSRQELEVAPVVPQTKLFNLEPENCYTIGEISQKFGVSNSTVYKHIRQYGIPTRQIGKFVYAPKSEIDKLYK